MSSARPPAACAAVTDRSARVVAKAGEDLGPIRSRYCRKAAEAKRRSREKTNARWNASTTRLATMFLMTPSEERAPTMRHQLSSALAGTVAVAGHERLRRCCPVVTSCTSFIASINALVDALSGTRMMSVPLCYELLSTR